MKNILCYERLRLRGREFGRITGVTPAEFEEIVGHVRPGWLRREESKKKSGRPYGMGGLEEQLIALLIYYRCYTTHLFIGALFGVDDSTITRRFAVLEPIVAQVTGIKKDRTLKQDDLETLLIDATEHCQPFGMGQKRIERPVRGQRKFYSGKKKCHTIKTEIQITEGGGVSSPFPSRFPAPSTTSRSGGGGRRCPDHPAPIWIADTRGYRNSTRKRSYLTSGKRESRSAKTKRNTTAPFHASG